MSKDKKKIKTLTSDDFLDKNVPMDFMRTGLWRPYPVHQHEFTEINLITNGTLVERINGRIYRLTHGNVIILTPGDTHDTPWAGKATGLLLRYLPEECSINEDSLSNVPGYSALFTPQSTDSDTQNEKVLKLDEEALAEAEHILARIHREFNQKRPGYEMLMRGLLMQYIVLLSRQYTHTAPLASYQFARLLKAIRYIEMNYTDTITLNQLADVAGMKRRNFIKVFSEATGLTPIEYLIHHRVSTAAIELRYTGYSITEIALQCGFSDSNYFARQFRKVMHMSPSKYRRTIHSYASVHYRDEEEAELKLSAGAKYLLPLL